MDRLDGGVEENDSRPVDVSADAASGGMDVAGLVQCFGDRHEPFDPRQRPETAENCERCEETGVGDIEAADDGDAAFQLSAC